MDMLMVGFNSKADAQTAFETIDDLRSDKQVALDDLALVYRNDKGKTKIRQTEDAGIGKGLLRGGVLGLVVGILGPAGAVASTVAGGVLGGVITAFDDGIDNSMMRALGDNMKEHEAILLALGTQAEIARLEEGFAPYEVELRYEVVPEASQNLIKEISKLSIDDLSASS